MPKRGKQSAIPPIPNWPADEAVDELWNVFYCMLLNGKAEYKLVEKHIRLDFEHSVKSRTWFLVVEQVKRAAQKAGVRLSSMTRSELCASSVVVGESLPEPVWNRVYDICGEIYGEMVRLDPDAQPRPLPSQTATTAGPTENLNSPNDPRDKFIYTSMSKNVGLAAIKGQISSQQAWEQLYTEQAVSMAARRYAQRKGLPWPVRRSTQR